MLEAMLQAHVPSPQAQAWLQAVRADPATIEQGNLPAGAERSSIEKRIAALLQWPVENGEGLQVLHYREGGEYRPHYDFSPLNNPEVPNTWLKVVNVLPP